jgi:hypothetical protein
VVDEDRYLPQRSQRAQSSQIFFRRWTQINADEKPVAGDCLLFKKAICVHLRLSADNIPELFSVTSVFSVANAFR